MLPDPATRFKLCGAVVVVALEQGRGVVDTAVVWL
jgi:hypothetical protein